MKKINMVLVLFLFASIIGSIVTIGGNDAFAKDKLVFGLTQPGTVEWYKNVENGFRKYCDENGIEVIALYTKEPQNSVEQVNHVETLIARGVDAIAITLGDSAITAEAVKLGNDAGIPFGNVGSPPHLPIFGTPHAVDVTVDGDNYEPAKKLTEYAGKLLGRKGNAIVLSGYPGNPTSIKRNNGALDGFKNTGIKILENPSGMWDSKKSYDVCADMLTKYKDIDVVFGGFGDGTIACYEAAKSIGRQDDIMFIGFDGTYAELQAIKRGEITASADMNSFNMAYLTAAGLYRAIKYPIWQRSWTLVEFRIITKENVDLWLKNVVPPK